jgi:hypothetical protein
MIVKARAKYDAARKLKRITMSSSLCPGHALPRIPRLTVVWIALGNPKG